jgi:hypothetical protein
MMDSMGRPRISLTIPNDMLEEIDTVRGLIPRERWIRAAIRGRLRMATAGVSSYPPVERSHSAAPTTLKDGVADVVSTFGPPPSTPQDRRLEEMAEAERPPLDQVIDAAGLVPASSLPKPAPQARPW